MFLSIDGNNLILTEENKGIEWGDLVTAVSICSNPPEHFASPNVGIWKAIKTFVWCQWVKRRYSLPLEIMRFRDYVKDYYAKPKFWTGGEGEGGKSCKAPWVYSVACFLETNTNMTEREIMSAPIGKMLWKSATIAEQLGVSSAELVSEEEMKAFEALGISIE